jgi:hypothetical protein
LRHRHDIYNIKSFHFVSTCNISQSHEAGGTNRGGEAPGNGWSGIGGIVSDTSNTWFPCVGCLSICSVPDIGTVIGCHLSNNSVHRISALVELPRSTISAVIVKWKCLGASTAQLRSGRPHKLTEWDR